jgi:hypothetical protein
MNGLLSSFESILRAEFRKYNEAVSKHCCVDINQLQKVCDQFFAGDLANGSELKAANPLLSVVPSPASTPRPPKAPVKAAAPAVKKTGKCPYVFKSGKQKDEACGVGCEEGGYCSKHTPKAGETPKAAEPAEEKVVIQSTTKSAAKTAVKPVIAKAQAEAQTSPSTDVRRNKWGNYTERSTDFVFDKDAMEVYGKQLPDGSVADLSLNDIELCKANGWSYRMPEKFVEVTKKKTPTVTVTYEDDLYEGDSDEEEEEEEN